MAQVVDCPLSVRHTKGSFCLLTGADFVVVSCITRTLQVAIKYNTKEMVLFFKDGIFNSH